MQIITDPKSVAKYGGDRMFFAPPEDYDHVMKRIPYGRVITVGKIREFFAQKNGADFTDPMTAGIFLCRLPPGQASSEPRIRRRIGGRLRQTAS